MGGTWVELRLCLSCGHVGCCNGSASRHAQAHHEKTGHPIVRAFRSVDDWAWCYLDESQMDPEWITQVLEANHRHECRVTAARVHTARPEPLAGAYIL